MRSATSLNLPYDVRQELTQFEVGSEKNWAQTQSGKGQTGERKRGGREGGRGRREGRERGKKEEERGGEEGEGRGETGKEEKRQGTGGESTERRYREKGRRGKQVFLASSLPPLSLFSWSKGLFLLKAKHWEGMREGECQGETQLGWF